MPSHSRVALVGTGALAASVEELHGRGAYLSCANSAFLQSSGEKYHHAKWEEAEGDWSFFSVSSVKNCPEKFSL